MIDAFDPTGFPVSALQRGLLLDLLLEREGALHLTQSAWLLEGELDVDALEGVWRRVIDRHGALRTVIDALDAEWPVQHEQPAGAFQLEIRPVEGDLSAVLDGLLAKERARGLDLSTTPMRVVLAPFDPGRALLVWTYTHLLVDGWSAGLVAQEVTSIYAALTSGTDPGLPPAGCYRKYVEWTQSEDLSGAEFFWAEQLSGVTDPTPLPTDGVLGRMATRTQWGAFGTQRRHLEAEASEALRLSARGQGLTLSSVVQAAWALLLSEYAQREETVFGVVVAGRPFELDDIETTVGMFANALPLRSRVNRHEPIVDSARAQHRLLGKVLTFQYAPLAQLRGWSDIHREQPFFLSAINVQNQLFKETDTRVASGLIMTHLRTDEPPQFPLQLTVTDGRETEISVDYLGQWFDEARAGDVLSDVITTLTAIAENPQQTFGSISAAGLEGRDRIRGDRQTCLGGHLLQLRGHRGCLEELEMMLQGDAHLGSAAVVPYEHGGVDRLAAYYVPAADTPPDDEGARKRLERQLPHFLVPDPLIAVDQLARTSDGRIDREALPAFDPGQLQVAPRTEAESALARIWGEVLGLERVGVFDNFFELGGESLAAMSISTKVSQALGVEVPMRLMLERQTVAAVAAAIEGR